MVGSRKDTTQAIMDGLLRFLAGGGFVTVALVLPNTAQVFGKPVGKLLNKLDDRAKKREVQRVLRYMKQRGLISFKSYDYENGIVLTNKGKKSLEQKSFDSLSIKRPVSWDKKWRLVFFDIPEDKRTKRNALTLRLRMLGYQQLQRSIWIHPFSSRLEIEKVTDTLDVRRFVTYVEISQIDGEKYLLDRFKNLIDKR